MRHLKVSINGGTPKWMVYFMENTTKMDDDWGCPSFQETSICVFTHSLFRMYQLLIAIVP